MAKKFVDREKYQCDHDEYYAGTTTLEDFRTKSILRAKDNKDWDSMTEEEKTEFDKAIVDRHAKHDEKIKAWKEKVEYEGMTPEL